jgi:hypothetical protein
MKLAPGIICTVRLAPRYTLLLQIVAEAWNEDDDSNETFRGYRTKKELGPRVSNPSNEEAVEEETVRAYVRELRAIVRTEIKRVLDSLQISEGLQLHIPHLIETGRHLGYRIGVCGIEILQPRASALSTR